MSEKTPKFVQQHDISRFLQYGTTKLKIQRGQTFQILQPVIFSN